MNNLPPLASGCRGRLRWPDRQAHPGRSWLWCLVQSPVARFANSLISAPVSRWYSKRCLMDKQVPAQAIPVEDLGRTWTTPPAVALSADGSTLPAPLNFLLDRPAARPASSAGREETLEAGGGLSPWPRVAGYEILGELG